MTDRDPLQLGSDAYAAATALDIDDRWQTPSGTRSGVPLAIQLLQMAGVQYREGALDIQMNRELGVLEERIAAALDHPRVGFLIEVSLYRDELGNPHVPGGQLLYPVGVGIHPIDALAENLRTPELRTAVPRSPHLQNQTYHVWIMNGGRAGMTGWTVAKEFRQRLVEQASKEARRRNLQQAWLRQWPIEDARAIGRAACWTAVYDERMHLIRTAERRAEIGRLNKRMAEHEAQANALYRSFQLAVQSIARAQAYQATLDRIATVTEIINTGMRAGDLISRSSRVPVAGAGEKPDADVPATREQNAGVVRMHERVRIETAAGVTYEFERMREHDARLGDLYQAEGIPIPERGEFNVPELP